MNEKYKNIPISTPIEPDIELDGGHPYCKRSYTELNCYQSPCPLCNQIIDWSWMDKEGN